MIRTYRLVCAFALALVTALVAPLAAQAAGYQFWGYYQLVDGEWGFAAQGAGTTVPEDGGVDGYRFAVAADTDMRVPRAVLEFDEICADTPAEDGMKRVGLVIDPGREVDAPQGVTPPQPGAQCVIAEPDATSQEILTQAVGDIRTGDSGLICGIAGYPAEGCGDEIADPTPEQLAADEAVEIPVAAPVSEGGDGAAPTEEPPAATDDPATDEATSDAAAGESATSGASESATDDPTTDDDATNEDAADEASSGVPPWAWLVGILVLLGLLGWAASASRNRRLESAERSELDLQRHPDDGRPWDGDDGRSWDGDDGRPHDPDLPSSR